MVILFSTSSINLKSLSKKEENYKILHRNQESIIGELKRIFHSFFRGFLLVKYTKIADTGFIKYHF